MRFDIPSYDQAVVNLMGNVAHGLVSLDPLHGQLIGQGNVTRHAGPIRNIGGSTPLDQTFAPVTAHNQLNAETIKNTDIDTFVQFMCDIAEEMRRGLSSTFFRSLDQIFDHQQQNQTDIAQDDLNHLI